MTFTTRAAGEMRGRLQRSACARRAGPDVPLRRAAAGAVLLAAGVRLASCRRCWTTGWGWSPRRRAGCGCTVDTAALRDLVGEIGWAKVSNVSAEDYVRVAGRTAPRAGHRSTRRPWPGSSPATRRSSATAAGSTSRTSCCARRRCSPTTTRSPTEVRRTYRHFVVDEYQDVSPLQQTLLDLWRGDRERRLRGRRSGPDHPLLRRGPGRLPDRLRPTAPRRHGDPAGPGLPLHPAGGRGAPTR